MTKSKTVDRNIAALALNAAPWRGASGERLGDALVEASQRLTKLVKLGNVFLQNDFGRSLGRQLARRTQMVGEPRVTITRTGRMCLRVEATKAKPVRAPLVLQCGMDPPDKDRGPMSAGPDHVSYMPFEYQ